MHIGIDASRTMVAARTGTEHYTYELIAALARQPQAHRYMLYTNRAAHLPPLSDSMTVRSIPFPRLWTHARLSAELLQHPPDLIFIPAHVVPLAAPVRRKLPVVVTIHDLGYLAFPAAHTRAQRLYLRLSTVWSARVATRVIAISEATRAELVRAARIDPNKIDVVYHGVSPRFQPADTAEVNAVRQRYHVPKHYFLYVGTIQPRKNLERLIRAYAQATFMMDQPPHLVIAGKRGWLTEAIEQQAAQEAGDRVLFTGYVADEDLPALLTGALAFTFPSLYEGFGMPVLEAMACGTPVLTSSTTALPEVAGEAALLVDPGDTDAIEVALRWLMNDASLRQMFRIKGFQQVARFSWERCAAQTLAVFERACADRK